IPQLPICEGGHQQRGEAFGVRIRPAPAEVIDLMEALKKSVERSRAAKQKSSSGTKKKATSSAKKTADAMPPRPRRGPARRRQVSVGPARKQTEDAPLSFGNALRAC